MLLSLLAAAAVAAGHCPAGQFERRTGDPARPLECAEPGEKAKPDPFCAPGRAAVVRARAREIYRPSCWAALKRLSPRRLDCADAQSIRDFKTQLLGAVSPDDGVVDGFARALCPKTADAACMNPEPQCRPKTAPPSRGPEALKSFYLETISGIDAAQAETMAHHALELRAGRP